MYIELDEGYGGHRKTLRLCALLQNPEADIFPVRLWQWAVRSAPSGDLTGMEPAEVEMACRHRACDGTLYAALVAAGFIDSDSDGTRIHGWSDRTGASVARMDVKAQAMRERRAHTKGECFPQCRFCAERSTKRAGTFPARAGNVPSSKAKQSKAKQREEEGGTASPPPLAAPPESPKAEAEPEPPAMVFRITGTAGGDGTWLLSRQMLADMVRAYPALDVPGELEKARTRVEHDQGMRKTARGMPKFLHGWLGRSQDWGRGRSPPENGNHGTRAGDAWKPLELNIAPAKLSTSGDRGW